MLESILDSLSAIDRIKLTSQLAGQVSAMGQAANAIERVRVGKQVADLVRQLSGDTEQAAKPERVKLTTQRLHSIIQAGVGVKSSKYSPSQRIDRTTYDVTMLKGIYGVMSSKHIQQIADTLEAAGVQFDGSDIARGFIKVFMWQERITAPTAEIAPVEAPVFPTKEAANSYSGISHSGGGRAQLDQEEYERNIAKEVAEAKPFAETPAQQAALEAEEAALRADYIQQYRQMMSVRAGTYSGYVAGRSKLNAKQANSRNSAYDKSIERFNAWLKENTGRLKAAVLAARSPEQLQAAQAAADAEQAAKEAKQAESQQKNVAFMVSLLSFKSGDRLLMGSAQIVKVSKNRDGSPSSLTYVNADGSKPWDDKINVLRVLYRGDKAKMLRDVEAARAAMGLTNAGDTQGPEESPVEVNEHGQEYRLKPVKADAKVIRAWHGVKREDLDIYLSDGRLIYAPKFGAFSTNWKIEPGIWFSTDKKFAAKYGEPVEFLLTIRDPLRHEAPLKAAPDGHDAVYRMHGKSDEIERALEIAVFSPDQIELADPIPAGAVKLSDGGEAPEDLTSEQQPAAEEQPSDPDAEQLQIVEHVTGRGKTIRGIVRTDLTYAEAKAIDEFTFKKNGGYFIREKHLAGYVPGEAAPVVKPQLTPEQQAQAEADRLANEQLKQQQKRTEQVAKLREVAKATIEKAEAELGRDRLANTARRARMAASSNADSEVTLATGKTLLNLADAIESGEATHLAGISSRSALETLQYALRQGMIAADSAAKLSYSEQERQKGRAPNENDAKHAKFPMAMWGTAGNSIARTLEAIKGKRGSVELAKKIQYSPGPDAEIIKALRDMIGKKEADYQLGWWSIEQVARADRLRRAGINNTAELQAALVEYLQFREGARKEDPIKAAERAIIGQKVGIDFFPTPSGEAQRMVQLAGITQGERVLEPSAGNGNIADAAAAAGAKVDVIEISDQLRKILEAKGYDVVAHDFMQYEPSEKYDAVLMNPPWTRGIGESHVKRAFGMLKPGGKLVALLGEGTFFRTDKVATSFRDWLEENAAHVEQLPKGTFTDNKLLARTSANGRMLVMQKG